MKKCVYCMVIGILTCTLYNSHIIFAASGQQENNDKNKGIDMQNEKIDIEIDKVVDKAKGIASKYNKITKPQILEDKRLISSEEEGNSQIIQLFDKDAKEKIKFIFTNNSIKDVSYRNENEDGYDIFYYINGTLGSFVEYKRGNLHGAFIKFYKNGQLQYIANCRDGKFIGQAKRWDESGKLIESIEFQQPQDFKIEKVAPKTTDN